VENHNPKLLQKTRERMCCEWCGRPGAIQAAHVYAKGFGGGFQLDHPYNTLALCVQCHAQHHNGERQIKDDLLALIAAREGVLQSDLEAELLRLRRIEGKPKKWQHRRK
jgi:hypothetical protein